MADRFHYGAAMSDLDWKFSRSATRFHRTIDEMLALNPSAKDLIHHNPIWAGGETLAGWNAFYETYRMTSHLAGHYAEVGTDKGASLLYFAKLFEQYEPRSFTECHGFDWFQGMAPGEKDAGVQSGSYQSDEAVLRRLIDIQELGHIAKIHRMDARTELGPWFDTHKLPLKIALMDAGVSDVLRGALPVLWANLVPNGVLILDHFSDPRIMPEVEVVRECLPGIEVNVFLGCRHPAAYAVKRQAPISGNR